MAFDATTLLLLGAGGVGLAALVVFAALRPAWAAALLVFAVPLTAGIRFRSSLPLGPDQAIVLCVFLGVALHELRRPRPLGFTGLDLVVLTFAVGASVIPMAVLFLSHVTPDTETLRAILLPAQYLLVYLVFARAPQTPGTLRLTFNLAMLAGVIVGVVAAAEAANVPGVQSAVGALYLTPVLEPFDPVYRPGSLLGFYSAVGAMGVLSYTLALGLATLRVERFPGWWMSLVMAVSMAGIVASQTWAALAVLPVVTLLLCAYAKRLPGHLLAVGGALAAAVVAFWPEVQARILSQAASQGSLLPETLGTRVSYWTKYFLPSYVDHGLWFGTGTVMPAEVPTRLVTFVDSEYLDAGFRGGLVLIALLATLFAAILVAGWTLRRRADPLTRAIGGVAAALSLAFAGLGITSEYLTFAGVSQQFWMSVGLLALSVTPAAARAVVIRGPWRPWPRLAPRLAAAGRFVGSSAVVFGGLALARLLGFGFSIATARLLHPAGFGELSYVLAVASVASVLLTTAPLGLSGYLSRLAGDPERRRGYYVSWLAVVGTVLVASLVVTAVAAPLAGIGGWLLVGLLCNVLGVAALETYREVQRGLGRYVLLSVFYVGANLLQLVAVVVAGLLGAASPGLFVIFYGLSSVVLLVVMVVLWPLPVPFRVRFVTRAMAAEAWRMARPLMLQSIFYAVWYGADLILLQHLAGPLATGHYGAAKTLASGLSLAPFAIGFVFLPVVARHGMAGIEGPLWRTLGLVAAVTVPTTAVLVLLAPLLLGLLFGPGYAGAVPMLQVLAVGMAAYGFYSAFANLWIGLGRPVIDTVSTALAMVVTVLTAWLLIPVLGGSGAAWGFSAGSVAGLLLIAGFTVFRLPLRAGPLDVPLAIAWRQHWRLVETLRGIVFRDRRGYPLRPQLEPLVEPGRPVGPAPPARVETARVGVITAGGDRSAAVQAARLLGLEPVVVPPEQTSELGRRAQASPLPLVVLAGPLPLAAGGHLLAHVERGGVLLVTAEALREGTLPQLGIQAELDWGGGGWGIELGSSRPALTRELTGAIVHAPVDASLRGCELATVLAWTVGNAGRRPLLAAWTRGRGAIVVGAAPDQVSSPVGDGALHAPSLLPALMLLGELYGDLTWRPPVPLANVTIDDPALRMGRPGIDWRGLLAGAEDHGAHVTVATVPRELILARPDVVELLATRRDVLTACYHGNDHSAYEFFDPAARRRRYAGRSLAWQRQAVAEAAARGRAFARRSGLALDRVMVFPQGIGPPGVLPALQEEGFLASVNQGDRYPMGGGPADAPWLGLRPADTGWEGFPLIWRRPLDDRGGLLLDLFLGRPAIGFCHRRDLGTALRPLVRAADLLRGVPGLRWAGLEEIARHAYLVRRDPERGWMALMTSNEICLHNPGPRPRRYLVLRPDAPAGWRLRAGSARAEGEELAVLVGPRSSVRVRLRGTGAGSLPAPPRSCALAAVPDRIPIAETA